MVLVLSLFTASAGESCSDPFAVQGSWEVAGSRLALDHGELSLNGQVLGTQVIEAPVVAGSHVAFIERGDAGLFSLFTFDGQALTRRITNQTPKQLAISDDGLQLAFVDGVTGFSSVYVMDFHAGEPRQLTNEGLVRTPGKAPIGFVPSPRNGLAFEGSMVVWDGPETSLRVDWRQP